MSRRSYQQHCALALALDQIGERWTLLIFRQLLAGPQRFTDLLAGLPGIGPNLLTQRLKQLVADELIRRRTLPPPAASLVYELTERGLELEPAVVALTRFGLPLLDQERGSRSYRPGWAPTAMKAAFRPEAARGVRESYEYRVDEDVFHARVDDGQIIASQGAAPSPAFVLTTDASTFLDLARGRVDLEEGMEDGRVTVEGDADALRRSAAIFGLSEADEGRRPEAAAVLDRSSTADVS